MLNKGTDGNLDEIPQFLNFWEILGGLTEGIRGRTPRDFSVGILRRMF